jgi:hypothetical protein
MQRSGDPVERYLGTVHVGAGRWFAPMAGLLALIWLSYPGIFFLDEQGIGAYTHPTTDALYTIVDVAAKVVYDFIFLGGILALEKRAADAMGRSPKEMEEYTRGSPPSSPATRAPSLTTSSRRCRRTPGKRRGSVGAPPPPVGRQSTRRSPRTRTRTGKTAMTCAARRATGETADASEHYREVEREVHIRRSHRRRSLPEQFIVAPRVLAPDCGKTSAKHRRERRDRHQDVEGAYLGLYFGNGHRDEPCTECFPNRLVCD